MRFWIVAAVAIPLFLAGMFFLGGLALPRFPLPAAIDTTFARVVLVLFALFLLLVTVAVGVKWLEIRRAARWPAVEGRVLSSEIGLEAIESGSTDRARERRVPIIRYAYKAGGRDHVGTRVTIAEAIADADVPAVLRRYPKGQRVAVYFDPARPERAVLERTMPGAAMGCLAALATGLLALLLLLWLAAAAPGLVTRVLPRAHPVLFLPALVLGCVLVLIVLALWLGQRRARGWPTTPATIERSEVVEVVGSGGGDTPMRRHRPVIDYAYRVDGTLHRSRQIAPGMGQAGSLRWATKLVARYPVGAVVPVHYDPKNPGEAILQFGLGPVLPVAAIGAVLLGVALATSGLFG